MVKNHQIEWHTRFFDLFPELKKNSRKEYYQITLIDLLSFRVRLFPYTYTDSIPTQNQFTGNDEVQRYQFTAWFLAQPPVKKKKSGVYFSNLSYVAAGLMLEKASGKPYRQLTIEFGERLGIDIHFGAPNTEDTLQPWGHFANLEPEAPANNHKLNWLLPAGNISMSLPDYARYIQFHLKGLAGKSEWMSRDEFYFLHYGLPYFALGWFHGYTADGKLYSFHKGNPGTFLSKTVVFYESGKAIVLFANVQSAACEEGFDLLFEELYREYVNAPKLKLPERH